jgi:hypothetical protein
MTEQSFEQLLEQCLGDYYANVPEPPGALAAGRRRMLDAATHQRKRMRAPATPIPRKERKPKMKLLLATRTISVILAVVIGIVAAGGGAALAASDSLPGDILYPAKLTVEDIRLKLASAPETQARLALQFADERVAEIEASVERDMPVPDAVSTRMEQHLQLALNLAAWHSEEEMPKLLEQIARRTQAQVQTMEQLLERLQTGAQEQNQARLKNALRICEQAHEEAMNGLDDPQVFRWRYQHRYEMPDDVTPPEPPTREPQNQGEEPGGPGEPSQNQGEEPGGPSEPGQNQEGEPSGPGEPGQNQGEEPGGPSEPGQNQEGEPSGPGEPGQNQGGEPSGSGEPDQNQGEEPGGPGEPSQNQGSGGVDATAPSSPSQAGAGAGSGNNRS